MDLDGGLFQDANLFQATITALVIEAIAYDELVGDFEADPIDFEGDFMATTFFEEDACFHVGGTEFAQALDDPGEGLARVEDVVDDEDMAVFEGIAQRLEAAKLAGAVGAGVAGEPDAGDLAVEIDGAK